MQRVLGVIVAALMAGVVGAGLGGCHRGARSGVPITGMEIAPEFGPTVDVSNFRGSVTVIADGRDRPPQVSTRVRSLDRGRWRIKDKELAAKVQVTADSGLENGRRVLRVVSTPVDDSNIAADLTIRVSRTEGVRVRNAGGAVELVRVQGPMMVENGFESGAGGDVTVRTGAAMTEDVQLTTTQGNVLYQVGPGSTGQFVLETDEGDAEFFAKIGKVSESRPRERRYRGILNDGTNTVSLSSGRGDVRAVIIENAGTYGPDVWDGYPVWPKYPVPIGRLGGHHQDVPLFRKRAQPE